MSYEVELKFRLSDFHLLESQLRQLGAVERPCVSHVDHYFNHPCRDFRSTDEAFRIRSIDQSNCLTYKGAVIGDVAKTRHEIEVGIADGPASASQMTEILRLLGFRHVRDVRKSRRPFALHLNDHDFELALDEVPQLGSFLEIELLAEGDQRDAAEVAVWQLARLLGLNTPESRSYLDLMIKFDGISAT